MKVAEPGYRCYKVVIHAVDGERWYIAGGPDRAELFAFLERYDHEGSSVALEWSKDDGRHLDSTDDGERVYNILAGREEL